MSIDRAIDGHPVVHTRKLSETMIEVIFRPDEPGAARLRQVMRLDDYQKRVVKTVKSTISSRSQSTR